MSIRPVDLNGMVQMTQDISTLKQNEDNKPVLAQHVIQTELEKDLHQQTQKVHDPEETEKQQFRYDAKEKGNNEYEQKKKKKKQKQEESKDKIVIKGTEHSFDIKI